jgi:hypothetical protein
MLPPVRPCMQARPCRLHPSRRLRRRVVPRSGATPRGPRWSATAMPWHLCMIWAAMRGRSRCPMAASPAATMPSSSLRSMAPTVRRCRRLRSRCCGNQTPCVRTYAASAANAEWRSRKRFTALSMPPTFIKRGRQPATQTPGSVDAPRGRFRVRSPFKQVAPRPGEVACGYRAHCGAVAGGVRAAAAVDPALPERADRVRC